MVVPEARLAHDKPALEAELVKQLDAAATAMGARTEGLNVETYVQTDPAPEAGSVYLGARYTGLETGEIIGGHHDGVIMPVERAATRIRVALERGATFGPLTDENSRWYERRGVSDHTGHWAYVPAD